MRLLLPPDENDPSLAPTFGRVRRRAPRWQPTPLGKLVDAFPLILESSRFLLHCAVAGLLPEGLAFACVRNATPLPITHSPVFPGLHEQQLARFGAVTAIGGVGDEKALLANVTAFWLWERMLRDPQRVRRAAEWGAEVGRQAAGGGGDGVDVARRVETGTEAGLMEIEAEEHTAWCTQQQLQPTALLSVARLLASVTAQLFRKNPRLLHQAVAAIADSGGGGNTEIVPGVAPEIALEGAPEIAHGGDPEMAGGARAPSRPLALDPWRGSDEVGLYARLGDEARRRRLRPLLRLLQPERAMPVPPAAVAGGEGVNGVTAVEAAPARGGTSRRIACSFFLRGSCKFGARCQNAHTADAERLICRHVSERGGCRYGAGCLYRHPGQEEDTGEDERVRAAAAAGLADPDLCICADDRGAGGGPGKAGRRAGADTGAATPGVHCSPQANYRGIVGGGVALMVEGEGVASPALGNVRTLRLVSPEEGGGGGGRNGGAGVVAGDLWRLHLPSSPAGVALSACPPCLVLWSRPTDACATAAGLRSLLLCLASKRLRSTPAAPLQLHLIGSAERVVVKAAALSGADDCFFSLIGVHAPPRDVGAAAVASGADAAITGGGATLCYAFSFNEPQWRDATALLPLLQHAPGAPLAPRWAALRISRLDASTDGSLAASLGTAGPAPAPATLQALASARVLAVDTESGGYAATLLQVAWVMMDGAGEVLDKYSALLQLPPSDREQISSDALALHGIHSSFLRQHGLPPKPHLSKLRSVLLAAHACRVPVIFHHKGTHAAQITATARAHGMPPAHAPFAPPLAASGVCLMEAGKRRCGPKPPTRLQLSEALFRDEPPEWLAEFRQRRAAELGVPPNEALGDATVTARCFVRGVEMKWWDAAEMPLVEWGPGGL